MPQPRRGRPNTITEQMEGRNETSGLLGAIDKSLDDMRAIITCRVCVRPLYEPFTLECGHTFCYTCLVSWFEKNTTNKTCPDCRARITRPPVPAYLIREISHLFSTRAELLPPNEATQEHQDHQQEEAQILEKDRQGRGLFRGCFRHETRRAIGIGNRLIIDEEDGVDRCPRCAWEVEDGECAGCGWPGETESWDDDSVVSLMLSEGSYPIDMGDRTAIDFNSHRLDESDDIDESDDESVGSLDEFVVQDDVVQGAERGPRVTRPQRQLEWRFPRREDRETSNEGSLDTLFWERATSGVISTDDDSSGDPSEGEELNSEEMAQLSRSPRSTYVDDAGNLQYHQTSAMGQANQSVVQISDDEDIIPRPASRSRRALRRHQVDITSEAGDENPGPEFLRVSSSDSDGPVAPFRARRRREPPNQISQANPNSRSTRNNRSRNREMARSRNMDLADTEEDVAEIDEGSRQTTSPEGVSGAEPRLIDLYAAEDVPVAANGLREREGTSRLDPATSIPVGRENINMPGAFPPSFVSEQGQSQSTPSVIIQDLTSSPAARQNQPRQTRQNSRNEVPFLDRRRREEQTYAAPQGESSHRRDRSAAKSARREDRNRVKAAQEARGRRNGEPSVPPPTAS